MIPRSLLAAGLTAAALLAVPLQPAVAGPTSHHRIPAKWANCTIVNHRLPHGVGRDHAHDSTSGTPVTTFKHDTALYHQAIKANGGLDRDHDGIACEKL